MSIPSLTKRDHPAVRDAASSQLPSPLYGLTIVSLAVFFVGLIVWRVPIEAYVVVSEVGRRAVADPTANPPPTDLGSETWDSQQMASIRQALADAIRYADARIANTEPDRSSAVTEERIQSVGSRLVISARQLQDSDHSISISFAGQNPAWSLALVENLTRDCLVVGRPNAEPPMMASRLLRDARWRIEQARHYERKARYAMEEAVDEQLAQHRDSEWSSENGSPSESELAASGPDTNTEPAREPNPQWLYLQKELADMTEQLHAMLSQLTPNHPQVRDLTLQMEAVRQQLDQTPVYLAAEVSQAVASATAPGGESSTDASLAAHKLEMMGTASRTGKDSEKVRELHERAVRNREEAEAQLATLMARQAASAARGNVESRWLITPPTVQGRIGGRPSARRVGAIGFLALLSGLSMAWSISTLKGLQRMNSVADLEQTLLDPRRGSAVDRSYAAGRPASDASQPVRPWHYVGCREQPGPGVGDLSDRGARGKFRLAVSASRPVCDDSGNDRAGGAGMVLNRARSTRLEGDPFRLVWPHREGAAWSIPAGARAGKCRSKTLSVAKDPLGGILRVRGIGRCMSHFSS